MRELLTILAAAALAVLVAALAIPPFVDWSAARGVLERRLGAALGGEAQIAGPVSVRLLPAPRFEAGQLTLRAPGYALAVDHASVEIGLVPLLRGAVSVTAAQLDRPRLDLDLTALATATSGDPAQIGIERLVLRNATLSAASAGAVRRLDHVDLTASAESAGGPFKADGFLRAQARILPFHLATGVVAAQTLPLKLVIEPLADLPRVDVAGTLAWRGPEPGFQGSATVSGDVPGAARDRAAPPLPWQVRLEGAADTAGARADTVEVRLGDDAHRLAATGTGAVAPDGAVALMLASRRPDLDRFRAAYDPAALLRALRALDGPGAGAPALSIDWRADAGLLGGDILDDMHATLARPAGQPIGPMAASVAASLPHAGSLSARGTLDGAGHGAGDVALRTDDADAFARWAAPLLPAGSTIPPVPFAHVDIAGHVTATTERVDVTDIVAKLDRSDLRGRMSIVPAHDAQPATVTAVLTAPALDIDTLPDLGSLAGATGALDLSLSLEAQAVRVARVGRGTVDAGRIALALVRAGETVSLDRLDLDDVGGATARLHGQLAPGRAHLAGTLAARQLGTLVALARRVAPSVTTEALAARAAVLAPTSLTVELDAASTDGAWRPDSIRIAGTAGDTRLAASLSPAREPRDGVSGTLALDAPDAAPLLQQLGLPVLPLRGQGAGHVEARLSGRPGAPLSLAATARLVGATITFDGTSSIDPEAPTANGTVHASAADVAPLLRIFGAPTDFPGRQPIDASAAIDARAQELTLSGIRGQIGATRIAGDLHRARGDPIEGTLQLDRLEIEPLAGLLLGRAPPLAAAQLWSPAPWSAQPPDPPAASVALTIGRLGLGGFGSATDLQARLAIGPRTVEARDLSLRWGGGTLAGTVALRRQGPTASLSAHLAAADMAVDLPWLVARASGRLDLTGAGASPAGLVASLAGTGTIGLADARLPRSDPGAPVRVATDVDAERVPLEPRTIEAALTRELERAPQAIEILPRPVEVAAGQAIVAPFEVASPQGATLSARLDLASGRVEVRDVLRSVAPPDWTGPPPVVALAWNGPVQAPNRTIDAADLIGTLAAHGLAREQARIAALEADQRERSFFNRRLKAERAADAERRAEQARQEAARQEAARQEAARQEAIKAEQARRDAARLEALRLERERRATEPAVGTAPLDLRPDLHPDLKTPKGGAPSILAPDPSSAGRY